MAKNIEIDKLYVKDIFNKWYRIPEYQRPYVWGSDQVIELVDDVYHAQQSQQSNLVSQYFLGAMVLKKTQDSQFEEFDVLDGQQRLITLFITCAVIRDMAKDLKIPSEQKQTLTITAEECIYQKKNTYKNIPERIRIIFNIREEVEIFVANYIMKPGATDDTEYFKKNIEKKGEDISIKNMSQAVLTIREYFKNNPSISEFFEYLQTKVLMIYVAAEELEDAFHLFTVMNNRGIKLRNSDILKAENLANVDKKEIPKYAKIWESIEEYFEEDFDNFLSHLRTVLVKQKAGYNLLKEYEENIYAPKEFDRNTKTYTARSPLLTRGKSTFDFIDRYYRHYLALFDDENHNLTNSYELYNQLVLMKSGFEADFWVAPLLRYYDKFKTDRLIEFLNFLDKKFSADWIIGLSPTDRIENTNAIIKTIDEISDQQELFESGMFNLQSDDLKRILTGGIYGRRFARYLLLKLDLAYHGHTTKFAPPETISIEHILPQTPDQSSQWARDFTESDREKWTDRLGNLILLSRKKNTAQGNLDYCDKKDKYFKKNVELFSNSVRIFNTYITWSLQDLTKNHKEALQKTLELYGVSVTDAEISAMVI